MRSKSRLATALTLCATIPGCFFGNIQQDVDRTPVMDAGAGASILMPGETAPLVVPGAGAPDQRSATQGSRTQSGAPHND